MIDKKKATILIADDSVTNSILIKGILESEGFTNIITVHNGKESLKFIKSELLSTIILDIKMPNNISGIDILEQLKSNITTKDIPVIIISANNNDKEIELCKQLGIITYLHKPVNIELFIETINKLYK
ncbi:MAG TPA: response regulator [Bacteroidales bacterium]|nr:MAG: Chemotaxis protein CheY [Bacteroidetes bacterium ADurb.Bin217]HPM11918.1 response regulator [Bacteroidales bacterium]